MNLTVEFIHDESEWSVEFDHRGPTFDNEIDVTFTTATRGTESLTYAAFVARFGITRAEEATLVEAVEESILSDFKPGYGHEAVACIDRVTS